MDNTLYQYYCPDCIEYFWNESNTLVYCNHCGTLVIPTHKTIVVATLGELLCEHKIEVNDE